MSDFKEKPSVVYVDLDGVLADLHNILYRLHGHVLDPSSATIRGRDAWDLHKVFGIGWEQLWEPVTDDIVENMEKTAEADFIMSVLTPRDRPWDVVFLSSPMKHRIDARERWLRKHYPDVLRVFTRKKFLCCKGSSTLLIDDYYRNTDDWKRHGGDCILVPKLWNERHEEMPGYFPDRFVAELTAWVEKNHPEFVSTFEDHLHESC